MAQYSPFHIWFDSGQLQKNYTNKQPRAAILLLHPYLAACHCHHNQNFWHLKNQRKENNWKVCSPYYKTSILISTCQRDWQELRGHSEFQGGAQPLEPLIVRQLITWKFKRQSTASCLYKMHNDFIIDFFTF